MEELEMGLIQYQESLPNINKKILERAYYAGALNMKRVLFKVKTIEKLKDIDHRLVDKVMDIIMESVNEWNRKRVWEVYNSYVWC